MLSVDPNPPCGLYLHRIWSGVDTKQTLCSDMPQLSNMCIISLSPQEAGLKEGDYIISVNGKDCKWSKHAEVVQLLKSTGEEGVEIVVITLQGSEGPKAVSHITSRMWETTEEVPLFLPSGWRCGAEVRHHVCSPAAALASQLSPLPFPNRQTRRQQRCPQAAEC